MVRPALMPILFAAVLALPLGASPPALRPAIAPGVVPAEGGMELPGGLWSVTEIVGVPVPSGVEVTMEFAEGRVAGKSGCNRYSATLTAAGESVTVTAPVATRMACPADVMAVESAFLSALAAATRFAAAEGRLTFHAGKTRLLRAVPAQ